VARRRPPRLIALSSGRATEARDVERLVAFFKELAEVGLEGCLVREPGLDDAALFELGTQLRALFPAEAGRWLGIHDAVHVALAVRADAVHLGFRSLSLLHARRAVDHAREADPELVDLALGLSTHAHDDPADWELADYVFHGPVFPTPSKVGLVEPVGLAGLREAVARKPRPDLMMLGLGGIDTTSLESVLATGVDGAAVLAVLSDAERPREVLTDLVSALARSGIGGEPA
jgi:thiamine-phosphate pyrophosphorylase